MPSAPARLAKLYVLVKASESSQLYNPPIVLEDHLRIASGPQKAQDLVDDVLPLLADLAIEKLVEEVGQRLWQVAPVL